MLSTLLIASALVSQAQAPPLTATESLYGVTATLNYDASVNRTGGWVGSGTTGGVSVTFLVVPVGTVCTGIVRYTDTATGAMVSAGGTVVPRSRSPFAASFGGVTASGPAPGQQFPAPVPAGTAVTWTATE